MQYMNVQLSQMLKLEKSQMEKIHSINAVYEIELARLTEDNMEARKEKINQLLRERNQKILEVLNEQQRKMLYTYCTDLISFSKMFE